MAKAKKVKEEVEEVESTDKIWQAKILKDYGQIFLKASDIKQDIIRTIPISPALDFGLGGGVPEAGLFLISGAEKVGKTTLALNLIKRAIDLYDKKVFIFDCEGRFYNMHLQSVAGLDLDKLVVIKSTKEKILAAHEILEISKHIIKTVPNAITLIDSSSSLCSESELTGEIKSSGRNETPKLLASYCRSVGQILPVQKHLVIIIQHLITNTSGWGVPFMEDGGVSVKFQCSTKIRARSTKKWIQNDRPVGQEVEWQIIHAPYTGGMTGEKVTSYIRYGTGIDSTMEWMKYACDLGIIQKAGAWFTYGDTKVQGEQKMYEHLSDNPGLLEQLSKDVKELYVPETTEE